MVGDLAIKGRPVWWEMVVCTCDSNTEEVEARGLSLEASLDYPSRLKMFSVLTLKDHSNSQTVPRTNLWFQYEFLS